MCAEPWMVSLGEGRREEQSGRHQHCRQGGLPCCLAGDHYLCSKLPMAQECLAWVSLSRFPSSVYSLSLALTVH